MAEKTQPQTGADDRTLIIERTFNAPRELVWRAWTEPKHIEQWWGPKGFTTRVEQMELRPGGRTRYVMISPDGQEFAVGGMYREVDPPARFVSTDEFLDDPPEGEELPQGVIMTATFEDLGDKTKVTLHIRHATVADRKKHEEMGVVGGWQSSFDCLDEHLAAIGGQS
jgi:uncharacterized protein YndB with AHSA1/START domain